jgi:hypothetical protein
MQKIALCLTGHFRNFEIAWPYLKKHVIDPYQPDVFGFAWGDTFGNFMHAKDKDHPSYTLGYDPASQDIPRDYAESVAKRLHPKVLEVFDPTSINPLLDELIAKHKDVEPDWEWHRPRSKYQMLYGRAHCNNLRLEYEKLRGASYDKIIFTRWDIIHEDPLPQWCLWDTRLILPRRYAYNGPSDIWAVGTSSQVNAYADMLSSYDAVKQTPNFVSNPHLWLRDALAYSNVEWILCNIPVMIANRPF